MAGDIYISPLPGMAGDIYIYIYIVCLEWLVIYIYIYIYRLPGMAGDIYIYISSA